jgi:hypothetical protein
MFCEFLGYIRLFLFEQGSYLEIEDAKNPDFFVQLQLGLRVRKLRTHWKDTILAQRLQPAAAKSVGMLNEK